MDSEHSYEPTLSEERSAQIRRIVMSEAARKPRNSRRPVAVTALAAAGVVGIGGAAAAWVAVSRPEDPTSAYCSREVTTDRQVWSQTGVGTASATPGKRVPVRALDACAAGWRAGLIQDPQSDGKGVHPVPSLTACVVEGQLVVYPSDAQVCARLGVPQAPTN